MQARKTVCPVGGSMFLGCFHLEKSIITEIPWHSRSNSIMSGAPCDFTRLTSTATFSDPNPCCGVRDHEIDASRQPMPNPQKLAGEHPPHTRFSPRSRGQIPDVVHDVPAVTGEMVTSQSTTHAKRCYPSGRLLSELAFPNSCDVKDMSGVGYLTSSKKLPFPHHEPPAHLRR